MNKVFYLLFISIVGLVFFIWKNESFSTPDSLLKEESDHLTIPLGLPPMPWPADNLYDKKKAELGRLLYFDTRLSSDGTISCATCHSIPRAFADPLKISRGILGKLGTRHAPTVINAGYQKHLFWDGRALTLEEQCKGPLANPHEMTLADNNHEAYQECRDRIRNIKGYRTLFKEVFGNDNCSIDEIAKAIATFERSILSGNSPYDRYVAGHKSALTEEQFQGYKIFLKSGCRHCHAGPLFTNGRFTNIGVGMDKEYPDLGRYNITHDEKDWGAFKVPTLREVAHSHPHMHDGSIDTLEEVIEYYNKGGIPNRNLHPLMHPLHLTEEDKKALLSFLKSLNGDGWIHFTEPHQFPN